MERLTNSDHKRLGFCVYIGKQNSYNAGITIGELAGMPQNEYSCLNVLEEVFSRLAAYEDTGLEPEEIEELIHKSYGPLHKKLVEWITAEKEWRLTIEPPNEPLSLDDLRKMVGEPVWVVPLDETPDWKPCWVICMEDYILVHSTTSESRVYFLRDNKDYGKTWVAYRRKPEDKKIWNTF